jgi:putative tricarboxylic transport membrane protein
MNFDWRSNKDFLAGLLFLFLGGFAVAVASNYPMGSTMRMGPGYFPTALGVILCLFGVYLMMRGIRTGGKMERGWAWRPLAFITLAIVLFGFLLDRVGMIPALVAMFFAAAAAGREFRFREVLLLTVVMGVFAAAIFLYGLKLPYQLLPGVWWIS